MTARADTRARRVDHAKPPRVAGRGPLSQAKEASQTRRLRPNREGDHG